MFNTSSQRFEYKKRQVDVLLENNFAFSKSFSTKKLFLQVNFKKIMKRYFFPLLFLLYANHLFSQSSFSIGGKGADQAVDIERDTQGNFLMASFFSDSTDFDPSTGVNWKVSKGKEDIGIAKYTTTGRLRWAFSIGSTQTDVPYSVRQDSQGNVYLAGSFSATMDVDPSANVFNLANKGGTDGFLAKYDSIGRFMWAIGIGSKSADAVYDIKIDNNGGVYVCGKFSETIDFDPNENVRNLVSNGGNDVFLAKYAQSNGAYQWAMNLGSKSDDLTEIGQTGLLVTQTGDCYLSATFSQSINFNPLGTQQVILNAVGKNDGFLAKYNRNGGLFWVVRQAATPQKSINMPAANLTVDNAGDIVGIGNFVETIDLASNETRPSTFTLTSFGGTDTFIFKYDVNGRLKTAFRAGGTAEDWGYKVRTDRSNNIIFTGLFRQTASFDSGAGIFTINASASNKASDMFLARYDAFGNPYWAKNYGAVNQNDEITSGNALLIDSDDEIVLAGRFHTSLLYNSASSPFFSKGNSDIFLFRNNADGTFSVDKGCRGKPNAGRINTPSIVCSASLINMKLLDYSKDENLTILWQESNDNRNFTNIATSGKNDVITVASINRDKFFRAIVSCSNSGSFDITETVKISPDNLQIDGGEDRIIAPNEVITLGGNPTLKDGVGKYKYDWFPRTLVSNFQTANPTFSSPNEGFYEFTLNASDSLCTLTRIIKITVSKTVGTEDDLETQFLLNNYPNPFENQTFIRFRMLENAQAKLQIIDVHGKVIQTILDQRISAGDYEFEFDAGNLPNGMYFYQLQSQNSLITKKMLLLK